MRYKHFYVPASQSLRDNEDEAWRLWSSTSRRGVSAVQYKRYQAAEIYLSAAYEIGLLRTECPNNRIFNGFHIIQPANLLIDLYFAQGNLVAARSFFNETRSLLDARRVVLNATQQRLLQEIGQRLTQAQRDKALSHSDGEVTDFPAPAPANKSESQRTRRSGSAVQGVTT